MDKRLIVGAAEKGRTDKEHQKESALFAWFDEMLFIIRIQECIHIPPKQWKYWEISRAEELY